MWNTGPSLYSRNSVKLGYSFDDFMDDEYPVWGDVFNDDFERRNFVVANVLKDKSCLSLSEFNGINPAMAEPCQSKALYLYQHR